MKNNDIRNAWDRILPDEAAEQRMLHRIQEYRAARGQKKRLKPVWIPAAVGALAAVALAVWGGSALRRMNEKLPAANPSRDPTVTVTAPVTAQTETAPTETAPVSTQTETISTVTETGPAETGSSATAVKTHRTAGPTATVTTPPTSRPTAPPTQPTATEEPRPSETRPIPTTGPTELCPPAPPEPPQITGDFAYTFENGDVLRFNGGYAGEPVRGNDYQVLVVSGTQLKKQISFAKSVSSGAGWFHRETGVLDRLRFGSVDGMSLYLGRHGVRAMNLHKPDSADSRVQGVTVRAGYFTTWDSQAWYAGGYWNPPPDINDLYTVHFYAGFTLGETEICAGWSGPVKDGDEMSGRLAEFVFALIGNGEPDMDAIHFNTYTGD